MKEQNPVIASIPVCKLTNKIFISQITPEKILSNTCFSDAQVKRLTCKIDRPLPKELLAHKEEDNTLYLCILTDNHMDEPELTLIVCNRYYLNNNIDGLNPKFSNFLFDGTPGLFVGISLVQSQLQEGESIYIDFRGIHPEHRKKGSMTLISYHLFKLIREVIGDFNLSSDVQHIATYRFYYPNKPFNELPQYDKDTGKLFKPITINMPLSTVLRNINNKLNIEPNEKVKSRPLNLQKDTTTLWRYPKINQEPSEQAPQRPYSP